MKTINCERRFQFCCGHRVKNHESKCRNLHGHNYVAWVTCESHELDSLGRVIDFSVIKQLVGNWIDENWDHGFVLWSTDHEAIEAVSAVNKQKLHLIDANPTAENMAAYLMKMANILMPENIRCTQVKLFETENCCATARQEVSRQ